LCAFVRYLITQTKIINFVRRFSVSKLHTNVIVFNACTMGGRSVDSIILQLVTGMFRQIRHTTNPFTVKIPAFSVALVNAVYIQRRGFVSGDSVRYSDFDVATF